MFGPRRSPADITEAELARHAQEAERITAWSERVESDLEEIVGTGTGASGHIVATVTAEGKVRKVIIGERAMGLDSRTLAEEVLSALDQAMADAERKTEELIRENLPGFDPSGVAALFERLGRLS
ncbi:YbaB/EbfC family nucleoid-associated protein [Nonomuraea sp. NPDC004297]